MMDKLRLKDFWQDEGGTTAIEYGIIAGLITVAIIAAIQGLDDELLALYDMINAALARVD